MLFNDPLFIFAFLPMAVAGYYVIGATYQRAAVVWLVVASLFFYAWGNPAYLALILLSICANYAFGRALNGTAHATRRRSLLYLGVFLNLVLLGYFKYAGFFVDVVNSVFPLHLPQVRVALPLAISFFTFTEIAYLIDTYPCVSQ